MLLLTQRLSLFASSPAKSPQPHFFFFFFFFFFFLLSSSPRSETSLQRFSNVPTSSLDCP
jgi:hypothetical protein